MNHLLHRVSMLIGILTIIAGVAFGGTNKNARKKSPHLPDVIPGQIVVKFKSEVPNIQGLLAKESFRPLLNQFSIKNLKPVLAGFRHLKKAKAFSRLERTYYLSYASGDHPVVVAQKWNTMPEVEYAEPLYVHKLCEIPDDPLYGSQDFFGQIAADRAWDLVKGEQGNVVIAIIDGGTEINHPDLKANLWTNPDEIPNNNADDDENGFVDDIHGWNFPNKSNDPTGLSSTPLNAFHGTLTAGIAAAVTNNGEGVAGVSWNAKIMAVNASSATKDTSIAYGFSGILYAAGEGADVISLSWGDSHAFSQFEREVIQTAIDAGATVIAAAGNSNSDEDFYPANYPHVISVAAVTASDRKASFSNYGSKVDVSAPGVGIFATISNRSYGSSNGTSFAAPIVAGVAALVKTMHPLWNGIQVGEQVRVSSDNIDSVNPLYAGQLGFGRVNAYRAVSDSSFPSLRVQSVDYVDQNENGIIQPGETVSINPTFFNYLGAVENVRVTLTVKDSYVTLQNNIKTLSQIGTMQAATLTEPFTMYVLPSAPQNHTVKFKVTFETDNYKDSDTFELIILPNFANIFVNNISTTITNIGRIGYGDTDNQTNGVGFSYKGGPNLLFEGALIAGSSPTTVVDAARSTMQNNTLHFNAHFTSTAEGEVKVLPGTISDQESFAEFDDHLAANPVGITVRQNTYAWTSSGRSDFVIFKYTILNEQPATIDSLYFGLFFDWDMDGETFDTNVVDFDPERKLGYAYDTSDDGPDTYVGVRLLSDVGVSYRAIYNDDQEPRNPSWGIYDGFTRSEKWQAISGGTRYTKAGPADVSHVLAAGPIKLFPDQEFELGFALAAGDNLELLQTATDTAAYLWNHVVPRQIPEPLPETFTLYQNYPNPFTPTKESTILRYALVEEAEVTIRIYNVMGRLVTTVLKETQPPGYYPIPWDGRDASGMLLPSGVYFVQVNAGKISKTNKLILIR